MIVGEKEACPRAEGVYADRVKTQRWFGAGIAMVVANFVVMQAQSPTFTRPGTIVVAHTVGEVTVQVDGTEKPAQVEERFRAEVTIKTGPLSTGTFDFSNGATLKVGSASELVVDEFWQQPHSFSGKHSELEEEPSPSLTRLRLVSGDVRGTVKPLLFARGSSFTVELIAGTLHLRDGEFRAHVQMTELGIGICEVELRSGNADFEPVGGSPQPLPAGRRLSFAVEINQATSAVKLSDMPKPDAPVKSKE